MTERFHFRTTVPKLFGESIAHLRPAFPHLAVALAGGMLLLGVPWLQGSLTGNAALFWGNGAVDLWGGAHCSAG